MDCKHLEILYEDQEVLVLNKPAGLVCHPAGKYQGDSVLSRLHFFRGKHVRLIHRLDQGTSGIMIAALTPSCVRSLAIQFERRKIRKEYLALVAGVPTSHQKIIDIPMMPDPSPDSILPNRMIVDSKGLIASTSYKILQTDGSISLLQIQPLTGRKHQIRFHLASSGFPILGENLYVHQGLPFLWERLFSRPSPWCNFPQGHALHAWNILFFHPEKKQWLKIFAPVPEVWANYMGQIRYEMRSCENEIIGVAQRDLGENFCKNFPTNPL
ncbi:MAG: RluA family pseudouridine synthase [Candidatus Brocadiae bacterium]|nr:RluA family pseudouridine synthase [Candidatus Brocadiia bacterium]